MNGRGFLRKQTGLIIFILLALLLSAAWGVEDSGEAGSNNPALNRDFWLVQEVFPKQVYSGQQAIYLLKFYRNVKVNNAKLETPDLKNFNPQGLVREREIEETLNGLTYSVTEIRVAIFPNETGIVNIAPARINFDTAVRTTVDFLLGPPSSRHVEIVTSPLSINVLSLPQAVNGFSGLIGEYSIKVSVKPTAIKAGEAATLTLTIEGRGNINLPARIKFPADKDCLIYPEKPHILLKKTSSGLSGKQIHRCSFIPKKSGRLTLSPEAFVYFDPKSETYARVAVKQISFDVSGADNMPTPPKKPEQRAQSQAVSQQAGPAFPARSLLYVLIAAAIPLTALGVVISRRRRKRPEKKQSPGNAILTPEPRINWHEALDDFSGCEPAGPDDCRFLISTLKQYLAAIVGNEIYSCSTPDLPKFLAGNFSDKELLQMIIEFCEDMDQIIYSGRIPAARKDYLGRRLSELLEMIERKSI